MWVFTTDGFFSVVHDKHCRGTEVTVRARCRQDLERLLFKIGSEAEILEIGHADYRWRAIIPRVAWAEYVENEALNIDYDNFKNAALADMDSARSEAYHATWAAMHGFQRNKEHEDPYVYDEKVIAND